MSVQQNIQPETLAINLGASELLDKHLVTIYGRFV